MTDSALTEEATRARARARWYRRASAFCWAVTAALAVAAGAVWATHGVTEAASTLLSASTMAILAGMWRSSAREAYRLAIYWDALDALTDMVADIEPGR